MEQVTVTLSADARPCSYQIHIGEDLLSKIASIIDFGKYSRVVVLTDGIVGEAWLSRLWEVIPVEFYEITIPAGEQAKSMRTATEIWQALVEYGCDRETLLLNLGGGVVGDIGGFAASTFMRGIEFYQIPTTLLSQVDASVGGKVGINFRDIKNLVGVFSQPTGVIIDVDTLATLPRRELTSGFAEVIKYGLIRDQAFFDELVTRRFKEFLSEDYVKIITRCCEMKSAVVVEDEKEGGLRKILNFGHTVGHALEALTFDSEKPLLHGEAVSIGMLAEAKISQLFGMISEDDVAAIETVLCNYQLPVKLPAGLHLPEIIDRFRFDKKAIRGEVNWTLLRNIGEAVYDVNVQDALVEEALESLATEKIQ